MIMYLINKMIKLTCVDNYLVPLLTMLVVGLFSAVLFRFFYYNISFYELNMVGFAYLLILILFFIPFGFLSAHYLVLALVSSLYYYLGNKEKPEVKSLENASVAILYATCNDFDPKSLQSCITQNLNKFKVYVLDDSSVNSIKKEIDEFVENAKKNARCDIVTIRRENKDGAKAGNINNCLKFINEDYCIICDADQILTPDFGISILAHIIADVNVAYVQGLHHARKNSRAIFPRLLRYGIYLFWAIVLPVRQKYGFPMFLGHGGIINSSILKSIKFPEVVAEDLAFSVACYKAGYIGKYAENIFSYESFPETVRDFRKRHMKWVRGTCEFLRLYSSEIIRDENLKFKHKWDIFTSLIQVPFGFVFICFTIINFFFALIYTNFPDIKFPLRHDNGLLLMSLFISIAPFLPFAIPLIIKRKFLKLAVFYLFGVAIYVATLPITFFGMAGYFFDKKADFITTGDAGSDKALKGFRNPNSFQMFTVEISLGLIFAYFGFVLSHAGTFGLGISFIAYPMLCYYDLNYKNFFIAVIGPLFTLYALINVLIALFT
jgi:cellulose synthase/poly-beta-1,6-N-acetylglucosamine synthase-like glycosyltransferase